MKQSFFGLDENDMFVCWVPNSFIIQNIATSRVIEFVDTKTIKTRILTKSGRARRALHKLAGGNI